MFSRKLMCITGIILSLFITTVLFSQTTSLRSSSTSFQKNRKLGLSKKNEKLRQAAKKDVLSSKRGEYVEAYRESDFGVTHSVANRAVPHNVFPITNFMTPSVFSHGNSIFENIALFSSGKTTASMRADGSSGHHDLTDRSRQGLNLGGRQTVIDSVPAPGASHMGLGWDGAYLWNASNAATPIQVYQIDPNTGVVVSTITTTINENVLGVTYLNGSLWIQGFGAGTTYEIDPSTGVTISSFVSPAGTGSRGLTNDGTNLWITGTGGVISNGTAYQVTTGGGTIRTVDISGVILWPMGAAWDSQRNTLFLTDNSTASDIKELDVSGAVAILLDQFAHPGAAQTPEGITYDGQYLWTAAFNAAWIWQIDIGDSPPLAVNVGTQAINNPGASILINTTINPSATFRNYGIATETFDVYFEIDSSGVNVYSDMATLTINSASGSTFVFTTPWTAGPSAGIIYDVTAYTVLVGDMDTSNDTLTQQATTSLVSQWIRCADRPTAEMCHATCYDPAGDRIYNFGGYHGDDTYYNWTYRYDPVTDSWATMAPMPTAIDWIDASAIQWNSSIYIFGGYNVVPNNYNYIYDIGTDSWSSGTNMPIIRMAGGQVVYNDSLIYMLGGYDGVGPSTDVQIYNTYTNSWTVGTALPAANMMEGVAIHGDTIWLVGGYNGAAAYSTLYYGVINPANCESIVWSAGDALPVPNFNNGATQMVRVNSCLYEVGGFENAATITNHAWEYNIGASTWTALPDYPMNISRNDILVARDGVLDTFEIYVCGGDNSGTWTETNQVWKLKWAGASALDVSTITVMSPPAGKTVSGNYDVIGRIHNFGTSSATFSVTANVYDTLNAWNVIFTQTANFINFPSGADSVYNFGTVSLAKDLLFYTEIYTQLAGDENPSNDTASVYTSTQLQLGDIIYEKEVQTPTGDDQLLGVEYDGTYFYVTGGGGTVNPDPNYLYVLDTLGNLIWKMDQLTPVGWGWRDLAWDNVYAGSDRIDTLYASCDAVVEKFGVDLTTGTLTNYGSYAGPENPNRALAWMDDNLWFYAANFAGPVYWFNKSVSNLGSVANTYTMYGSAYDTDLSDGGWIWWHSQDDPGTGWFGEIEQYDPSTQTFTGLTFGYQPTVTIPAYAGGLSFYEGFRNCDVLFALVQGDPDAIVGLYVRDDQPPLAWNVGTQAINVPGATVLINETVTPSAMFRNYGANPATFNIYFRIDSSGVQVYSDNGSLTLNPGMSSTFTFPTSWTAGPTQGIVYDVTAYTVLLGDMDTSNDTLIQQTTTTLVSQWIRCADRPTAEMCHATCYDPMGDRIYNFGGYHVDDTYYNWTYRYDPKTNIWATMAAMPTAIDWIDASVIQWDRKIYIFGGYNVVPNSYNYIYDIGTDSWSSGTNIPLARIAGGQVIYNDSLIYMLGGYNGAAPSTDVQVYNTYTNSWTVGTVLPAANMMEGVAILGDTIWLVGGYDGALLYTTLYYGVINPLNCETITWTVGSGIPDGSVFNNGATQIYRQTTPYLYAVGGFTGNLIGSITDHAWEYDVSTSTWTALPNYPMLITRNDFLVARDGVTDTFEIYVCGGDNSGSWTETNQVWKLKWGTVPPTAVELSSFTGDFENGEVLLRWKTECEKDNALWRIDRRDDKDWNTIGTVPSEGNSPKGYSYECTDSEVQENRSYTYRLGDINIEGKLTWRMSISVYTRDINAPKVFGLNQSYPNPFAFRTSIKYQVPRKTKVTIDIYDLSGRRIRRLVNSVREPGYYQLVWDGTNKTNSKVAAGMYFCRMSAGNFTKTRRIVKF